MKKTIIFLALLAFLVGTLCAVYPPRIYHGLNTGVAWDIGGIEFAPSPGIFLCEANRNDDGSITHYPTADWFPELVADC